MYVYIYSNVYNVYVVFSIYSIYIYKYVVYFKVFVCKYSSLLVYKVFVMLFLLHCCSCYCLELFLVVVVSLLYLVVLNVNIVSVNELHGQERNLTNMKRRIRRAVREFKLYLKSCQLCAGREGGRRMSISSQRLNGKCKQIAFHDVE